MGVVAAVTAQVVLRTSGGGNMDHVTVPKVRRRARRGWEPQALFRCPTESPGTPFQTFSGSSLMPSSRAGIRIVLRESHPLSTKLYFSQGRLLAAMRWRGGLRQLYPHTMQGVCLPGPSLPCPSDSSSFWHPSSHLTLQPLNTHWPLL